MKEKLLPNSYKKIGLIFAFISLFLLITNIINQDLLSLKQESIDWILKDIFLASLLIIAFTKEKVESKKIIEIRFNKLKQSVIFGGFIIIADSLLQIISNYQMIRIKEGFHIIVMILLFYLITFNFRKFNYN